MKKNGYAIQELLILFYIFAIAWNRCAWRRRNMRWQVDLSALVHKWQRWGEVTMARVIVSR